MREETSARDLPMLISVNAGRARLPGSPARLSVAFERCVALVGFVVLWELLPRLGIVSAAYLSPPSDVAVAIVRTTFHDPGRTPFPTSSSQARARSGR